MSKRGYLWRYGRIIQKVKQQPYVTKRELIQYLESETEHVRNVDDEIEVGISERTVERDLREIRNLVGISIKYIPAQRGYIIEGENAFGESTLMQLIEQFELYRSLNAAQKLEHVIYPEKERPRGMEHMTGLMYAIEKRLRIRFVYTKFWDDEPENRAGKPYALKEFNKRWYVLLQDDRDDRIKLFGLDRMNAPEVTNEHFTPVHLNVEEMFTHCYGITIPDNAEPQEVILAFTPLQAKYVKSLPLHHSQRIVSETPDELRISLHVYLTIELEKQILSYGEEATVIQPQELINRIEGRLEQTIGKYRK